jgi:hypothetical protein
VLAFVTLRIDYCNSVLVGLPQCTLRPLKRVQNSAFRLIFDLRPHDYITPGLMQLHWLSMHFNITFKLCLLMFLIRNNLSPQYLSDMVQPIRKVCCGLRSAEGNANLYNFLLCTRNSASGHFTTQVRQRGSVFPLLSELNQT